MIKEFFLFLFDVGGYVITRTFAFADTIVKEIAAASSLSDAFLKALRIGVSLWFLSIFLFLVAAFIDSLNPFKRRARREMAKMMQEETAKMMREIKPFSWDEYFKQRTKQRRQALPRKKYYE